MEFKMQPGLVNERVAEREERRALRKRKAEGEERIAGGTPEDGGTADSGMIATCNLYMVYVHTRTPKSHQLIHQN